MTTVDTSRKIVTSIMPLELLESSELDYNHFWCIYRGGSRISGKDVHMYKGTGFAFLILSHFSKISHVLKLFHFKWIFKNGVGGRGLSEPSEPPLDPPLI